MAFHIADDEVVLWALKGEDNLISMRRGDAAFSKPTDGNSASEFIIRREGQW